MSIPETLTEQRSATLDAVLADLGRGEAIWAATSVARRRELLAEIHGLAGRNAQAWVDAASLIKGLPADSPLLGEEWLAGPYGLLTGLALTPMSAFAILLIEQTRIAGFEPAVQVLAVMAGMMLLQELLGPVVTQRALMAARETHVTKEG